MKVSLNLLSDIWIKEDQFDTVTLTFHASNKEKVREPCSSKSLILAQRKQCFSIYFLSHFFFLYIFLAIQSKKTPD